MRPNSPPHITKVSSSKPRASRSANKPAIGLSTSAALAQEAEYSTAQLEKALRETKREYKEYKSLSSKLQSAAKQSSNTSRETVIHKFQDFMGECVVRREGELSKIMTIKRHGEMVTSGTTDVVEVGSPVPTGKNNKELGVYSAPHGNRVRQISNMKALYISAKHNSRLAIERQGDSLERYTVTIDKFGQQLTWAIDWVEAELARQEAVAKANESRKAAQYEDQDK